jgi:signal transduction histidine kinase
MAHKSHVDGVSRIRAKTKSTTGDLIESTAAKRAMANLGLRLLSLQEGVQQRIASDLHDSTCQHLIAASLNVMRMRRAIKDGGGVDRICDDVDASIDQALREIRDFTDLLHPKTLLADGLKFTIEHFVKGSCSHVAGGQSRCRFGSRQVVVCGAALSAENYSRSPDERFPSCESDACVRSVLDEMGRFNDQAS